MANAIAVLAVKLMVKVADFGHDTILPNLTVALFDLCKQVSSLKDGSAPGFYEFSADMLNVEPEYRCPGSIFSSLCEP